MNIFCDFTEISSAGPRDKIRMQKATIMGLSGDPQIKSYTIHEEEDKIIMLRNPPGKPRATSKRNYKNNLVWSNYKRSNKSLPYPYQTKTVQGSHANGPDFQQNDQNFQNDHGHLKVPKILSNSNIRYNNPHTNPQESPADEAYRVYQEFYNQHRLP